MFTLLLQLVYHQRVNFLGIFSNFVEQVWVVFLACHLLVDRLKVLLLQFLVYNGSQLMVFKVCNEISINVLCDNFFIELLS